MMCGKLSLIVHGEKKTSLRDILSFIQRTQKNGECLTDIFKGTNTSLIAQRSIMK